jgi:hypothetical protein
MKYLLLILIITINYSFSQTGNIKGRITDSSSSAIPSVNIFLADTQYGTISDQRGYYDLRGIPPGKYKLRISSVGYQAKIIDVEIFPGRSLEINAVLESEAILFEEVQVTGFQQQEQKDTRTSLIDLNPRSAKILPGAVEDVFRTLQTLPGVLAPSDFSSQLIVRGSGPDQNLIIMDDVEIFNPYRLYGLISMFNPEAVSDVNLISGGFPAKYGDRLSAVLDVTNREGNRKEAFTGNINASIIDANIVLEGKNPFNIDGSWLINSRRTYYDLIVEPFVKNAGLVEENVSFPNFHDIQTKIVFGPFNGHKILLNGVYSRDGVNVVSAEGRKTADSIGVYNQIKNDVMSVGWHYVPNQKFLNKFVFSWYRNSGATNFDSQILDPSLNRDEFEDIIPDTLSAYLLNFKFDADFSFRKYSIDDKITYLWGDNVFEAGAGADFMTTIVDFKFQIDPELRAFLVSNPQFRAVLSDIQERRNYNRYRSFVQNNFKITEKLYFNPSLRFDYYDILDKSYAAPRLSLSYALDDLTTLRAVWGIYYQSPGYEKIVDQNILYDLSQIYTSRLEAEKAVHYVLGIERWLTSEWSARLEGYYKDFSRLISQQKVPGTRYFTERIPDTDPRFSSGWTRPVSVRGDSLTQIPINASYGEAYGLELFLSKKNISNDDRLSGWISYSLAYANRFEEGKELPFRFDQTHTFNFVMNYKFNHWLDLGVRWQFGSGFPITTPVGIKPRIIMRDTNADGIPDSPEIATRKTSSDPEAPSEIIYDVDFGDNRFNDRKPNYHRMDIRLTALADYWDLDWSFYLDIINVYNRSNVVNYDYFIQDDLQLGREATNMFPILPTLGFSVRF